MNKGMVNDLDTVAVGQVDQTLGTGDNELLNLTGASDDPTPNSHYIFEAEKPELFSLIEKIKNCDSDTQKRLLAYFQMISEQKET